MLVHIVISIVLSYATAVLSSATPSPTPSPATLTVSKGSGGTTLSIPAVLGIAIGFGIAVGAVTGCIVAIKYRNKRNREARAAYAAAARSLDVGGYHDDEEALRSGAEPKRVWDAVAPLPVNGASNRDSRARYADC